MHTPGGAALCPVFNEEAGEGTLHLSVIPTASEVRGEEFQLILDPNF